MFAAIFVLVLLPWLDTSKVRSSIFRPIYRKFFWVLVATVILLGYLGAKLLIKLTDGITSHLLIISITRWAVDPVVDEAYCAYRGKITT